MLCWGNAKDGQLGIGVERNPVFEPRNSHVFNGRGLKEVACGGQHSVFLLHDGSVYTCGSNSCGQLGHEKPGTFPGKLSLCIIIKDFKPHCLATLLSVGVCGKLSCARMGEKVTGFVLKGYMYRW